MNNELKVRMTNDMTNEAFRAAYALNVCTVSVSQIVDYQDIFILEQEYDAILNNLNLELMPKDDALLDILKQLLDTITFFRISEGDKEMIEIEYENKMKNAIWNSVPNFGMIFAGSISPLIKTNLISIGASLATQVGIGYMNYRKNKAEYELEKDRAYWKLQRTAIEQFNALRRELFSTAWRLAEKYEFPDNFRLTEKQIRQYNTILEDDNELRRYERLLYVKDSFYAYPPFWYFMGHAASEIAVNEQCTIETREYYRKEAIACYEAYCAFYSINILRQDQIMASCALEYIELLDPDTDKKKIIELLDLTKTTADYSKDVLQICAFSYLKINEIDKSAELFRYLVNEKYNSVLNAQMLSQIYVIKFLSGEIIESKRDYETLTSRINTRYLFPFPKSTGEDADKLAAEFFSMQKKTLNSGFERMCKLLFQKNVIGLNKIIPCPDPEEKDPYYFSNEMKALNRRRTRMKNSLERPNKVSSSYVERIKSMEIQYSMVCNLNELLDSMKNMDALYDIVDVDNVLSRANRALCDNTELINKMQGDSREGKLTYGDYEKAEIFFDEVIRIVLRYMLNCGKQKIERCNFMAEIVQIEQCLLKTCENTQIPTNVLAADNFTSSIIEANSFGNRRFSMAVFGSAAMFNQNLVDSRIDVVKVIKENLADLLIEPEQKSKTRNKPAIYINGTNGFEQYIKKDKDSALYADSKSKIAAFIVEEHSHFDLILTGVGVYVKQAKNFGNVDKSDLIPYGKIEFLNSTTLLFDGEEYKNPILNMNVFINIVNQINERQ